MISKLIVVFEQRTNCVVNWSTNFIKKIYGVNLNSVFTSAAAATATSYLNYEENLAEPNYKSFINSVKLGTQEENLAKSSGAGRKSLSHSKTTAEKNLLFLSQNQQEDNMQKMQMMISRKRKIPVDYSEFNKNGVYDKSIPLELKQQKVKEKDLHAKSFNCSEDASALFASFAVSNFAFGSALQNSASSNNNFNNSNLNFINNNINFANSENEKYRSSNKIFIKRKNDNKRKSKFKNAHAPHLHFSHQLLSQRQQEKSEAKAGLGRNGSAKGKRISKNFINSNDNDFNNDLDHANNNSNAANANANIFNNNFLIPNEDAEVLLLKDSLNTMSGGGHNNHSSSNCNNYNNNNNLILQNQVKTLNLNESEDPCSFTRERGRPSKKSLQLESLLNSQRNSSSNLVEKLRVGNAASATENFLRSVNEDFPKCSYDASSHAKFGVNLLNENEDKNEFNNPPVANKEFRNEIKVFEEKERKRKFGRGREAKHFVGARAKVIINFVTLQAFKRRLINVFFI